MRNETTYVCYWIAISYSQRSFKLSLLKIRLYVQKCRNVFYNYCLTESHRVNDSTLELSSDTECVRYSHCIRNRIVLSVVCRYFWQFQATHAIMLESLQNGTCDRRLSSCYFKKSTGKAEMSQLTPLQLPRSAR